MPQNLPQLILQRIVRLLADGTSQQEVARMLGVFQGCIQKILRCNRETGRPHQRKRGASMKISTPREDPQPLQMVRTNRFMSARRLQMQMIRRFGSGCQFQPFGDGFWSPDIGLTLEQACGASDNRDNVSSVMSPGSPYTTVTVWSECAVGKGGGWLMPASSLMMEIMACQSWYGVQSTMGEEWAGRGGWSHKPASVHPDPEE